MKCIFSRKSTLLKDAKDMVDFELLKFFDFYKDRLSQKGVFLKLDTVVYKLEIENEEEIQDD